MVVAELDLLFLLLIQIPHTSQMGTHMATSTNDHHLMVLERIVDTPILFHPFENICKIHISFLHHRGDPLEMDIYSDIGAVITACTSRMHTDHISCGVVRRPAGIAEA